MYDVTPRHRREAYSVLVFLFLRVVLLGWIHLSLHSIIQPETVFGLFGTGVLAVAFWALTWFMVHYDDIKANVEEEIRQREALDAAVEILREQNKLLQKI